MTITEDPIIKGWYCPQCGKLFESRKSPMRQSGKCHICLKYLRPIVQDVAETIEGPQY